MKEPTGLRARHYTAFRAERDRIVQVIAKVWKDSEGQCAFCGKVLQRPGDARSPYDVGYVRFRDPKSPQVDGARLYCGPHFGLRIRQPPDPETFITVKHG